MVVNSTSYEDAPSASGTPRSGVKPSINGYTHANGHRLNGTHVFKLGEFSIDDPRPMKVVVIGAGYSGIIAGIRFPQRVPNLAFTIYEAQAGIGGTWFVNKYPGLACDIPSHCYQLTFEENINWSSFYAPGPEILAYLESVVAKYKLMQYIKLRHRVVRAQWDAGEGKWHLRVSRPRPGCDPANPQFEEFDDTADVLLSATGALHRWSWPEIEGLAGFSGKLVHSAQWDMENEDSGWEDSVKDWGDKRVGVIGVGSSAIQIVPALQPRVAHMVNYVRGKNWLSTPFLRENLAKLASADSDSVVNYKFTAEDKEKFKDPEYYRKFRWELESDLNSGQPLTLRGNPMQEQARVAFKEAMLKKLAKKPWIADELIPGFAVACRRLTPGPGYLESLCEDNVDYISSPITRITQKGIETADGNHQDLDVIVCATGFDASYLPEFAIVGRDGVDLRDKYTPHPRTYLSMAVDGFPNFFQALGPNSAVGAGSQLIILERQIDYAVAATLKLQKERLKSIEPKKEAVDDFDEFVESYFPKTIFSEKCRSWYKAGKEEGRIVALWPGSSLHITRALANPRWEDYNYESLDGVKNRFYYMGDGMTLNEKTPGGDRAWYLHERDIPSVP